MKNAVKAGIGVSTVVTCAVIAAIVVYTADLLPRSTVGVDESPWNNLRLPDNIRAIKYRLYLDINWANMTYSGTQEVTLNITGAARYILIHASDHLTIERNRTTLHHLQSKVNIPVKRSFKDWEMNPDQWPYHDFYVVEPREMVAGGQYKMKLHFSGAVQTKRLTGMYRSGYVRQIEGEDLAVHQIVTDFEPARARTAFPCLDEPDQKGKWETDITVTFPGDINVTDYSIISNMPLKAEYIREGQTLRAAFQESVPMSTYLVCFVVSDFKHVSGTYTRGDGSTVDLRVYARREPQFQESAAYALQITPLILQEYEEFYKVHFPLPKLDQVALPQFMAGAMENFGLITYKEYTLLYNPATSSLAEKQRVCSVVAHELAHQWFGNIVTMAWWNDLWLNEGFATFAQYYGINAAEPGWDITSFFYSRVFTRAMLADSSPNSHPLSVSVEYPEEITGIFDAVSYAKGSAINWMMQKFMGEEAFKRGLENYIGEHQWGNAEMVDLFNALTTGLEAGSTLNITEIMLTWTMQMGFPYVDVSLHQDEGTTIISLRQHRFLAGKEDENTTAPEYGYKWHIPFTYVTVEVAESPVTWMLPEAEKTVITVPTLLNWVKGNAKGNFYYITNYQAGVWSELSAALQAGEITSPIDRTSLIYDAFSLAGIGKIGLDKALDMTKYGVHEREYMVLKRIVREVLSAGDSIQDNETAVANYWAYTANMLQPRVYEVGWGPKPGIQEPMTTSKMREMVLKTYCEFVNNSEDAMVNEALTKFAAFAADPGQERTNIKDAFGTIMKVAIIYDDQDGTNWHKMWKLLQSSEWEADQKNYLSALSKTKNETLLRKMVAASFEEGVKGGCWRYLYYVHYHGYHYELGWELLQTHWSTYVDKYWSTHLMPYLAGLPDIFNSHHRYEEVEAFYKSKWIDVDPEFTREILAKIRSNIEWGNRNGNVVNSWFASLRLDS